MAASLMVVAAASCRGSIVFGGPYSWANFTILALGVWAVAQRDSVDAISMVSGPGVSCGHGSAPVVSLLPVPPTLPSSGIFYGIPWMCQVAGPLA